jgi:two-component system, LytTR family, response regulator
MYKTVIIEDDPFCQETLKDLLTLYFKEFEIVGVYSSVEQTMEKLAKQEVDLVFLDMELSDGLGFDILKKLEEIHFEVIVTTMHDSFMLEAIKHSAIDYLMKPITRDAISSAIEGFEKRISKFKSPQSNFISNTDKPNRLVIPHQNGLSLLDIKNIIRLESDGAYTKLFVLDGSTHFVSKNIGHFEDKLKQYNFFRVHHGHLVNAAHVKNFVNGTISQVIMTDGSSVSVSRRKKDEFLKKINLVSE